ncbi:MAG: ankyrin repeat domain-containing protein [Bacteroidales bacterium]|nr:ankyrin repeat domain-containing protein [Bacteroidales bacterium]
MKSKLRKAVYKGNTKKITSLVKKGADIDELDENDRTILLELTSYFISLGYNVPPELIKLLIDLGANVNYTVKRSTSINYNYKFETPLANAVECKKTEIVKVLLENGADPNAGIDNSYPPARIIGLVPEHFDDPESKEIRRLLLEYGAKS